MGSYANELVLHNLNFVKKEKKRAIWEGCYFSLVWEVKDEFIKILNVKYILAYLPTL